MNSKRLFYGLIATLVLVIGLGVGAIVYGKSMLEKKTATLTQVKIEAKTLLDVENSLSRAKADITKYAELESILKTVVPQEKDQARTVREIVSIASDAGVSIDNIGFPSSTLGDDVKPGATAAPKTNTQLQKVDGISNVERLEITVSSSGKPVPFESFLAFLDGLENNRRTAQVSSVNVLPDANNRNLVTFSLIVNVYIKK